MQKLSLNSTVRITGEARLARGHISRINFLKCYTSFFQNSFPLRELIFLLLLHSLIWNVFDLAEKMTLERHPALYKYRKPLVLWNRSFMKSWQLILELKYFIFANSATNICKGIWVKLGLTEFQTWKRSSALRFFDIQLRLICSVVPYGNFRNIFWAPKMPAERTKGDVDFFLKKWMEILPKFYSFEPWKPHTTGFLS